jgi:hypothetical protein
VIEPRELRAKVMSGALATAAMHQT